MFERRDIKYIYLKFSKKIRNFLLSEKSREFLIFLFFFLIASGFWLLQTLNNDYEAEFSIPVRLKEVPNDVVITSEPSSELRIKVKDRGTVLLNYMLGKSFFPVNLNFNDYSARNNHVRIYSSEFEKKIMSQLNVSTRLISVKPDTLEYIYSHHVALAEVKGAKFIPNAVDLTFPVDMYTEKTVEVPLHGVNFPADKVLRTFPSKVQITFQVGYHNFYKIEANSFIINISYEELLKLGSDKYTVKLKSIPDGVSHIRIAPKKVDFLIEQVSSNGD